MFGSVMSGQEIRKWITRRGMVRCFFDLDKQLTSNGFDLTLKEVHVFNNAGYIDYSNVKRKISETTKVEPVDGVFRLKPGVYKIVYNEVLCLPLHVVAFGFPRSSLLRCGVTVCCAVFDAGYYGRSESLMVVGNPCGFTVERNARVVQLVFVKLTGVSTGFARSLLR